MCKTASRSYHAHSQMPLETQQPIAVASHSTIHPGFVKANQESAEQHWHQSQTSPTSDTVPVTCETQYHRMPRVESYTKFRAMTVTAIHEQAVYTEDSNISVLAVHARLLDVVKCHSAWLVPVLLSTVIFWVMAYPQPTTTPQQRIWPPPTYLQSPYKHQWETRAPHSSLISTLSPLRLYVVL